MTQRRRRAMATSNICAPSCLPKRRYGWAAHVTKRFVAPAASVYTFRARFDDVGELWLSRDADPRYGLMIESSSATTDGIGLARNTTRTKRIIALEVLSRFAGPLYITLLGSAAGRKRCSLCGAALGLSFLSPVTASQAGSRRILQQARLNSRLS